MKKSPVARWGFFGNYHASEHATEPRHGGAKDAAKRCLVIDFQFLLAILFQQANPKAML
jgi:hypothetical protein